MKTIKIFLASSEELTDDRNAFGNLVRRLDNIYEKRGIRIELFEWEDYDAAYNDRRKQDEYNEKVRASDMFLAMFYKKAGKFTIEEFDVATEEFRLHASPKVYTYCKDLAEGEQESPELTEFKRRLFEEMGHYWSRYNNRDSMQLHFVMQLQLVDTSGQVEKLKLEDGTVVLADMPIARLDNLQFAAGNEAYQKMSAELASLPDKIEKARQRVDKFPDDDDLRDDLQQKLNRNNSLKEEFEQLQNALFETAKRVSEMQVERVSSELRRAVEAFEQGHVEAANAILDGIEREADHHMEQLDRDRELVHQDIEAFQLQAKTVMADVNIPIKERIQRVSEIYAKADDWAEKSALEKEKYESLLDDYANFLYDNAFFDKAMSVLLRQMSLRESLYGKESPEMAESYSNIGVIYNAKGNYSKALEYHFEALAIREELLGIEHQFTAVSYHNIGMVYDDQANYEKALDYYVKALDVREKVLGEAHLVTVSSYNNIGLVFNRLGDYSKALGYFLKAKTIIEKLLGTENAETASSYTNIGTVYHFVGDYTKAFDYYLKSVAIYEKLLGEYHPLTAVAYSNIGGVYDSRGDYKKALDYYSKALAINKEVFGEDHIEVATSYNNLGNVYSKQEDSIKAMEYYSKSLIICEKVFGQEHPQVAMSYNNIGYIYNIQGDYSTALAYFLKALAIWEKTLGPEHPNSRTARENIEELQKKQSEQ